MKRPSALMRVATTAAIAAAFCVVVPSAVRADSITLRSGKTVTGIVKQVEGGYEVAQPDGKKQFVSAADVKSIKLSNEGKVTEAAAIERLASLKRSVESERDLDRIIDRYDQFIEMNADTEAAKQAQAELDQWKSRRDQKMVKVGHKWLTPAERDEALNASAKVVDQICGMIANGDVDHATTLLRHASEDDPENVSFQYLTGVLQFRRSQFNEAKRSFDAVAAQIGDHPPTIINLAVLAVQFKRWPQAVTLLDQALTLAPGTPEVLDNVIEFEQLAPDVTRRTAAFEKLLKRAGPQEAALEQRQAARGLYRWGSTWVDQATLARFKQDRDAFEKKKADMEADYAATQQSVRKNEENIQYLERMIQRMEADSLVQDTTGHVIRQSYPPAYWDAQRDLEKLQKDQRVAADHIADLKKQAVQVKQSEPKPPYAGTLNPVGDRGVPVILPGSAFQPTSMPTTLPGATPTAPAPTSMPADTTPATSQPARGLFEE